MKQRVITALALIPPVLLALFARPEWPIAALALVVAVIGASEIARMLQASKDWATIVVGPVLLVAGILTLSSGPEKVGVLGALGGWILGLAVTYANTNKPIPAMRFLSSLWVAAPMLSLAMLHRSGNSKADWVFATPVLLAIVPLWGGDTAAIFAGKAFGKHKLAPKISPKKTWEGAIANLLACILVAVPLAIWIGYGPTVGIACGLVAGVLGQAGDLFESFVKRAAGLKDSGTLLPGHGGIMDRIDSILFTAPAVAAIVTFANRTVIR